MGPGSAIHMHKSTSPVLYRRGHATGRQYSWDPLPPGNPQAPPKETSLVRRIFVDYVRIKLRVLVPALVALGLGVVAAAHFYTKRFIIEPVTALLTTTPASPAAQISAAQRLRWAIVSERVAEQYAESNVVPLLLGVLQAGATVEVTHEVVMTLEALVAYPSTARVMLVHGGIRTLQALLRDPHLPLATGTTCAEVLQVLLDTKERDKVIVQGGGTG